MKAHSLFLVGTALALLGVCTGLQAQDSSSPYSYVFKMRLGLTAGDIQKTHFDNKVMGFGAEVKREMFANGGAELRIDLGIRSRTSP